MTYNTIFRTVLIVACAALTACSPRPSANPAATTAELAHAFSIGELKAVALRDGTLEFPNDNQVFGAGRSQQEVAAVLGGAGLPTDKLQLGLDPLLVKAGDRILLFDTGAGGNFGASAGHLAAALAAGGVDPGSVTDIFISHVHGDHVGGLVDAQGGLAFPKATIHLAVPEWAFLQAQSPESAANLGIKQYAALMNAMKWKVAPFLPGAQIIPGLVSAVEIKGHTPGHSGYLIGSGSSALLYVGDAVHHFVVSVQKPDWANGFDGDRDAAAASRAALLAQAAASGQRIYAVHFPFPGLGKFVRRDAGYAWVAE